MVFPVVMYGCKNWTIKKAEHRRIDAFQLWCWRRLLRVLWTIRRSNQSILKEISPGCSLEGLMLKLKIQYLATWCKELTHLKRPWYSIRFSSMEINGDHDSSVQSLSCVWLFATPWTAAHQASLSITNSRSLLKCMSIESVMPSNHLILCHPLLLLP